MPVIGKERTDRKWVHLGSGVKGDSGVTKQLRYLTKLNNIHHCLDCLSE